MNYWILPFLLYARGNAGFVGNNQSSVRLNAYGNDQCGQISQSENACECSISGNGSGSSCQERTSQCGCDAENIGQCDKIDGMSGYPSF